MGVPVGTSRWSNSSATCDSILIQQFRAASCSLCWIKLVGTWSAGDRGKFAVTRGIDVHPRSATRSCRVPESQSRWAYSRERESSAATSTWPVLSRHAPDAWYECIHSWGVSWLLFAAVARRIEICARRNRRLGAIHPSVRAWNR